MNQNESLLPASICVQDIDDYDVIPLSIHDVATRATDRRVDTCEEGARRDTLVRPTHPRKSARTKATKGNVQKTKGERGALRRPTIVRLFQRPRAMCILPAGPCGDMRERVRPGSRRGPGSKLGAVPAGRVGPGAVRVCTRACGRAYDVYSELYVGQRSSHAAEGRERWSACSTSGSRAGAGRRTGRGLGRVDVGDVLGHDDREAGGEVEVDVAVEEPRARVVRLEPDRDVVAGRARADHVTLRRVNVVVVAAARAPDDPEGVLDEQERDAPSVLEGK